MRECKFFGQLLNPEGMNINPKKFNAIMWMRVPKCKKELKCFQGMVNYLKCYSSQLKWVAEPFKELIRNDTLCCLKSKHKNVFKAIKEDLTKTPVWHTLTQSQIMSSNCMDPWKAWMLSCCKGVGLSYRYPEQSCQQWPATLTSRENCST